MTSCSEKYYQRLTLLISIITILAFILTIASGAIVGYGFTKVLNNPLLQLSVGIIGSVLITASVPIFGQLIYDAYSNLYHDLFRPRGVSIQKNGQTYTITAKQIPKNTSLILARETDSNIGDLKNTVREVRTSSDRIHITQDNSTVFIRKENETCTIPHADVSEFKLYYLRQSLNCHWIGETKEVTYYD